VGIAGLYAGDNIGDTALKESVVSIAEACGVTYGVQYAGFRTLGFTYYPRCESLLVGGGAIGQNDLIEFLATRYAANPGKVVFHGVDFAPPERLSNESQAFLRRVGKISCRSTVQADRLADALGRPVSYAPDNAFCHPAAKEAGTVPTREDTFGINVVPFSKVGILPGAGGKKSRAAEAYRSAIREAVITLTRDGVSVTHLPFTPADEQFAADLFQDLDVTLKSFRNNPAHRIRQIAGMERFVATRLHAHIFAILARTPFLSISYAGKCRLLQADLSIPPDSRIRKEELIDQPERCTDRILECDYFQLPPDQFDHLQTTCRQELEDSFDLLQN
jgi:polysaccharide pyruvyl transferase WcaK-like protein